MYYIRKRMEIAGGHYLDLDYPSKCCTAHGHNWIITVFCRAEQLNHNGMVVDFSDISEVVKALDHTVINKFVPQPTAENIAKWIMDRLNVELLSDDNKAFCHRVIVQESENNEVTYEEDVG